MADEKQQTLIDRMMSAKGDEIRAAREKLGISQQELATRTGTNQQTIDRLERGVTRMSKFMPEIRGVLGLPFEEPEESLVRFSGRRSEIGWGVRARIADDYMDDTVRMPIFQMIQEGEDWIISAEPASFIPRAYPVEETTSAYGVIVPNDEMAPALRSGEIAVINPDETGEWGGEMIFLRGLPDGRIAGMFRAWFGYEHYEAKDKRGDKEQRVKVKSYNPPNAYLLPWLTWPAAGAVVAKLPPLKK